MNHIDVMKQALADMELIADDDDIVEADAAIERLSKAIEEAEKVETPQREWVGLTDEEIDEGQKHSWVEKQAFESAVWWAEEQLKGKNT